MSRFDRGNRLRLRTFKLQWCSRRLGLLISSLLGNDWLRFRDFSLLHASVFWLGHQGLCNWRCLGELVGRDTWRNTCTVKWLIYHRFGLPSKVVHLFSYRRFDAIRHILARRMSL